MYSLYLNFYLKGSLCISRLKSASMPSSTLQQDGCTKRVPCCGENTPASFPCWWQVLLLHRRDACSGASAPEAVFEHPSPALRFSSLACRKRIEAFVTLCPC